MAAVAPSGIKSAAGPKAIIVLSGMFAPVLVAALLCVIPGYAQPTLRERATKGDPDAQFTLAKNYEAGRGGLKKDYTEAKYWYQQAADQGDPFAQASLALLYRFGKGVPQDYVQAYMWFNIAASALTGPDQESILELRDATAAKMTAQQVAEATRLSRAWKARKTP